MRPNVKLVAQNYHSRHSVSLVKYLRELLYVKYGLCSSSYIIILLRSNAS